MLADLHIGTQDKMLNVGNIDEINKDIFKEQHAHIKKVIVNGGVFIRLEQSATRPLLHSFTKLKSISHDN